VIDGLGDRPIKELGYKTPLESAKTPNLDFMAQNGICGLISPVYLDYFPTSKDGHLSLFGYDIKRYKIGRGVFEVIGIGMKFKKGDLALRGNLATVDEGLKIIDRRAGRIRNGMPFVKLIDGMKIRGVRFYLKSSTEHRLGLLLRGKNLSEDVSDGDFHKTNIKAPKIRPLKNNHSSRFTAEVLNEFLIKSHKILKNHPLNLQRKKRGLLPANYILLREPGKIKEIPSFYHLWKLKACFIAGGALYKGIGRLLKMKEVLVKGATGRKDTNLKAKFISARKAIKNYDLCYLHIKATDNFSHDGDFYGKRSFIEKIDKNIKILLLSKEKDKFLIIVTADHSTPSKLKEHSKDPIPFLVYGLLKDGCKKFSERYCKLSKFGIIKQNQFLKKIFSLERS
jgi:2,3-bisphosphoglycerate-independent phosphoglycerate mutase